MDRVIITGCNVDMLTSILLALFALARQPEKFVNLMAKNISDEEKERSMQA